MNTRLQLRTTVRERLEDMTRTPLWSDVALNESLAAIHAQGTRFPKHATYADPNDVEAEVQACTTRPSRTGGVDQTSGVVGLPV
jgi:hypothetical protein